MREILFKAKRLGGGEWVEGLYAGMCKTSDRAIMCATEGYFHNDGYVYVDPSTVGQYTGLKDKNGVRIFEGDVVKLAPGAEYSHVVEWYDDGWGYGEISDDSTKVSPFTNLERFDNAIEITGNIHGKETPAVNPWNEMQDRETK